MKTRQATLPRIGKTMCWKVSPAARSTATDKSPALAIFLACVTMHTWGWCAIVHWWKMLIWVKKSAFPFVLLQKIRISTEFLVRKSLLWCIIEIYRGEKWCFGTGVGLPPSPGWWESQ